MKRLILMFALAACLAGGAPRVAARVATAAPPGAQRIGAGDKEPEYRVKAAFLYNFIRYTNWPDEAFEDKGSPIVLMVVGKEPFGPLLEKTFGDKKLHGRRVVIERAEKVPERVAAHIVFAGELEQKERARLLGLCRDRPTLLVGEASGFASSGAQCNFYLEERRVRFEINIDAVEDSELDISSQLLKLARIVRYKEKAE